MAWSKITARTDEGPERTPLLSDDAIRGASVLHEPDLSVSASFMRGGIEVRDFYEGKITSGELMVVKTCRMTYSGSIIEGDTSHPIFHHEGCPDDGGSEVIEARIGDDVTTGRANYCPGCGAVIEK